MMEERVFGDGLGSDIPHHALHHMTDGAVAQKWSGPVFGVQGERI